MKNLGILSSGQAEEYLAILERLQGKDVTVTCINTDFKSDIFEYVKRYENVKAVCVGSDGMLQYFSENDFDLVAVRNCSVELKPQVINASRFVKVHPSLLPAFAGADAVYRAFDAGVKVTGITVHYLSANLEGGKIVTQYPILIPNLMHYDELQKSIKNLEDGIFPIVIEKILEDKVFDFQDLLPNKSCDGSGGCSSRGGCSGH